MSQLATSNNFISIGGGKEALVLLAEKRKKIVCIKAFRPYSSSNVKRKKQQHHITNQGMANMMAKTEYRNLRILEYFGIQVPHPIEYKNGLVFSMKMIPYNESDQYQPAPLLKEINLTNFTDPGDFLEITLDQIEIMFKNALMVHGDLSEYNILVSEVNKELRPYIIDVSQSRLYNNKTFTTSPIRIRLDEAIKVLTRDVTKILNHFESKYRINIAHEDVFTKLFSELPAFAKEKGLLDPENLFQHKPSKTAWMNMNEIDKFTNKKMSARDKKIQRIFKSLN